MVAVDYIGSVCCHPEHPAAHVYPAEEKVPPKQRYQSAVSVQRVEIHLDIN